VSKVKRIDNLNKVNSKTKSAKANLLYIFLIPLFISVVISLFKSDYALFGFKIIAFFMLYFSIKLIDAGLENEQKYHDSKIIKVSKIPYKIIGAILLAISVFYLMNFINKLPFMNSLITAIIGGIGVILYYGVDILKDKTPNYYINMDRVLKELNEAQAKINKIQSQKEKVLDYELKKAISNAANNAQNILDNLKEDPKDIDIARKFMVVYLDGIKDVLEKYGNIDKDILDSEYRERLISLLNDASKRFEEELIKLKSNDMFDLDVQIDSLKKQLKH